MHTAGCRSRGDPIAMAAAVRDAVVAAARALTDSTASEHRTVLAAAVLALVTAVGLSV